MNKLLKTLATASVLVLASAQASAVVTNFDISTAGDVVGFGPGPHTTGVGSGTYDSGTGIFSYSLDEHTDLSFAGLGWIDNTIVGDITTGAGPSGTYTTTSCTGDANGITFLCASGTLAIGVTQGMGTFTPDPLVLDTTIGASTIFTLDAGSVIETWTVTAVASPVPVPAAAWLFGSGLLGMVTLGRKRRA